MRLQFFFSAQKTCLTCHHSHGSREVFSRLCNINIASLLRQTWIMQSGWKNVQDSSILFSKSIQNGDLVSTEVSFFVVKNIRPFCYVNENIHLVGSGQGRLCKSAKDLWNRNIISPLVSSPNQTDRTRGMGWDGMGWSKSLPSEKLIRFAFFVFCVKAHCI